MKFFVPGAASESEAQEIYSAILKFTTTSDSNRRIWKLNWTHKNEQMECEVGEPLPQYYRTGTEPVIAILEEANVYKICTHNRGVARGEPVYASRECINRIELFNEDE